MGIAFIWPGFKWKKGIDWSIKSEFYHKNTTINKTTNKQNEKKTYIYYSVLGERASALFLSFFLIFLKFLFFF